MAHGLGRLGSEQLAIHSAIRPWRGTIAEVDRAARSFAATLQRQGIGPGSVVLFQLPNWVEAAIAFWGAAYAGAAVVPVVHFYGVKELDYILQAIQPDVVVTPDRFGKTDHLGMYEALFSRHGERPWFVVGDTPAAALPSGARPLAPALETDPVSEPAAVDPEGPAVIGFTSGTTRDPKGVVHSSQSIVCEARQLRDLSDVPGRPPLVGAPVGHFMGMTSALLVPLFRDRSIHLIDVWDAGNALRAMRADDLSIAGGAPYFLTSLIDHPDWTSDDDHRIGFVGIGGAPVPTAVTDRLTKLGALVARSYGSTEHPSITGSLPTAPAVKRLTTDGMPTAGVEIRLDEEGQIFSRGPDLCIGYTDAELTANTFDADGWYRTGDVGAIDGDGYLTITDRVTDVIIRGGENISAQEIEEQLLTMPAIAEVSVVAAPDDRLGERAAAVISVRPGNAMPTLSSIRAHLAERGLAKQKWPESVYALQDLPRTPSGKVQKFKLREMIRGGGLPPTDSA